MDCFLKRGSEERPHIGGSQHENQFHREFRRKIESGVIYRHSLIKSVKNSFNALFDNRMVFFTGIDKKSDHISSFARVVVCPSCG